MDFLKKYQGDGWNDGWYGNKWRDGKTECATDPECKQCCANTKHILEKAMEEKDNIKTTEECPSCSNNIQHEPVTSTFHVKTPPDFQQMYMSTATDIKYNTEYDSSAPQQQEDMTKEMCKKQIDELFLQVKINMEKPQSVLTQANLEEKINAISDEKFKLPIRILTQEEIVVLVNNSGSSVEKQKLMDSGSNRGLTPFKNILRDFKTCNPIPVAGIGNTTACHIKGKGYMYVTTDEGNIMEFEMWWAPESSSTVVSPNAAVKGSNGKFTSWTQTSHVDNGHAALTFFHRNTKDHATITMNCKNDLWYINKPYRQLRKRAPPSKAFTYRAEEEEDTVFVGNMSAPAMYELWHQRTDHAGQRVMEALPHCCDGVPAKLSKCKHDLYKCESCDTAKSTGQSGNEMEDTKATQPGERFHMDFEFVKGDNI